jgi:hypothetical protein
MNILNVLAGVILHSPTFPPPAATTTTTEAPHFIWGSGTSRVNQNAQYDETKGF